ncbi:hypothetical protein [Flavimaricola marinus]|uniref:Uncharacterized protein n=1 Tax=Flavimaricola marinus TaxID=1819565 RepID=A0A238LIB4_9RHOB|nr:hypothetical protein [Flavimaricola marinus]SMY08620.1 hypothetical protein LOM8899_02775 [Flavimaricola marinus]
MNGDAVTRNAAEISRLMSERMRISGRSLEAQVRKAGRALPRARAREARYLVQAQQLSQNPKLARMIDERQVTQATANLTAFLSGIDPKERRKDRLLGILGILAANVLLIGGAAITYLWWQGLV